MTIGDVVAGIIVLLALWYFIDGGDPPCYG